MANKTTIPAPTKAATQWESVTPPSRCPRGRWPSNPTLANKQKGHQLHIAVTRVWLRIEVGCLGQRVGRHGLDMQHLPRLQHFSALGDTIVEHQWRGAPHAVFSECGKQMRMGYSNGSVPRVQPLQKNSLGSSRHQKHKMTSRVASRARRSARQSAMRRPSLSGR